MLLFDSLSPNVALPKVTLITNSISQISFQTLSIVWRPPQYHYKMDGQMFFKTLRSGSSAQAPIQFTGNDETNCFPVSGSEVQIITSSGKHEVGSAKLQIKNFVNYG